MTSLIIVAAALLLLVGFLAMVNYEATHGVRFFAPRREALDLSVERLVFIWQHVDLAAFLREETRRAVAAGTHALVTLSLRAVRAVERLLTRLVRHLRTKAELSEPPHETAREFVKTLSEFKDTLKTTRPEVSEV